MPTSQLSSIYLFSLNWVSSKALSLLLRSDCLSLFFCADHVSLVVTTAGLASGSTLFPSGAKTRGFSVTDIFSKGSHPQQTRAEPSPVWQSHGTHGPHSLPWTQLDVFLTKWHPLIFRLAALAEWPNNGGAWWRPFRSAIASQLCLECLCPLNA